MKKTAGFAILEILLVVVVIFVIGFAAVRFYSHSQAKNGADTISATATVSPAPQITQSADLDNAADTLDQTDVGSSSSDSDELDSELSDF